MKAIASFKVTIPFIEYKVINRNSKKRARAPADISKFKIKSSGDLGCALLSTNQKWNYILSKRATRSVLRGKKTPRTSYIREYLRTCQHWKGWNDWAETILEVETNFTFLGRRFLKPRLFRERKSSLREYSKQFSGIIATSEWL